MTETVSLPKLTAPTYELILPSTKKPIKYRPFLMREEKILLMALESNEQKTIIDSIKQIVNNCIITKNIDVNKFTFFDLEYVILQLRARSIGEISKIPFKCTNLVSKTTQLDDDDSNKTETQSTIIDHCGNLMEMTVNLLEIVPTENTKHTNKIFLTEDVGVVMRYPAATDIDDVSKLYENQTPEAALSIVKKFIEYIFDKENVYYTKEVTKEALDEFIESLSREQMSKIEEFFNTQPKLEHTLKHDCSKCGFHHEIKLEGLQSFFE